MSTPRRFIFASIVVAFASLFACAAPPESQPEPEPATSSNDLFVDASQEAKQELGVSRWRIETNTEKARTFVVTGLDDRGATRAQLWVERASRGEGRTAIEVGASSSSEPILSFVMEPDGTVNDIASGVTDRPELRRLAELAANDVQAWESAMGRTETSLTQSSLFPRGKELYKPTKCCVCTKSGEPCNVMAVGTVASCIVGALVCGGSLGLGCAGGAVACGTGVGNIIESGCNKNNCK